MTARNVRVFRVVAALWLLGWFWKAPTYAGYYLSEIWTYPLRYDALPRVLVHPALLVVAWLAPLLALGAIVWPRAMRAAAIAMTVSALVGCLHFETCNDATFVTSLWSGLWLVWFTANADRDDDAFRLHARVLAQLVISLVFLGAVVGKLTGAYIKGDAFYHLYFMQKQSWPYSWMRESMSPGTIEWLAVWFSRAAVVTELAMVATPLMPARLAAIGSIVVMFGMVAASTWYLVSVMASLAALCAASLLLNTPR